LFNVLLISELAAAVADEAAEEIDYSAELRTYEA